MAGLKKWFQKQRLDVRFNKAGSGHRLTEESGHARAVEQQPSVAPPRSEAERTEIQRRAAEAAMSRLQTDTKKPQSRSQQAIREQAQRELALQEARLNPSATTSSQQPHKPEEREFDAAPLLAVQGVYFTCDLLDDAAPLPLEQLLGHLEAFLRTQLQDEPLLSAATMLSTLNRAPEKRQAALDVMRKYLDNLLKNPGEEKYRKIRCSNKVFQEKVAPIKGSKEFLNAAGFQHQSLDGEDYLVALPTDSDHDFTANLELALTYLDSAEPVPIQLYRDPRILAPGKISGATGHNIQLPPDFFDKTAEEIKREQGQKTEEVEKMRMLRTKEMRERDELKRIYRYKYTVLRIRFPDDYLLQGTFRSGETMAAVESFIRDHITHPDLPFELQDTRGAKFLPPTHDADAHKSLAELQLAPAALLNFKWDPDVAASGVVQFLSQDFKDAAVSIG